MTMKYVWLFIVFMCSVQGCPTGYFGQNCSKPCVYPSFGERCQGECNCTDEMCNIITGCKVLDCHDGFYGSLCTKPCRYPSYGFRCQGLCDCSRESCNHIAGCRKILGINDTQSALQCEEGYYGLDCLSPCRYPNFGRKCQFKCNCTLSRCNHIKGCRHMTEIQMFTTKWDEVIKPNKQTWLTREQLILIIAGSFVIFIFTFIGVIMVARKRKLQRKRNTEPDLDSEFSSFQSNEDVADSTNNITTVQYCRHDAFRENYGDEIYANSCT